MTKRIGLMVLMAAAALAPAGMARGREDQVRYNPPQRYENRYNEHETRYRVRDRHDDRDYRSVRYDNCR